MTSTGDCCARKRADAPHITGGNSSGAPLTGDALVLSRELVRPVTLTGDPKVMQAQVSFDLVLERL